MKNLDFVIVLLVLFFANSLQLSDEEMKEKFIKITMACMKDYKVDMTDLLSLQKLEPPTKPEVKCLLACAYRKTGNLNSKGLYDVEGSYKIAEMSKNGDEQRLENAKKMVDICAKVNDQEVSDGEKGCERAALIFNCVAENAPKLGFKVQ